MSIEILDDNIKRHAVHRHLQQGGPGEVRVGWCGVYQGLHDDQGDLLQDKSAAVHDKHEQDTHLRPEVNIFIFFEKISVNIWLLDRTD